MDEDDGWFGVEGGVVTDPYNPAASRSPAGFDLPHVLSGNVLWEIPVGKGMKYSTGNGILDYVLGNWQINNIVTWRSGQAYTPIYSSDQANTGNVGWAGYSTRRFGLGILRRSIDRQPRGSTPARFRFLRCTLLEPLAVIHYDTKRIRIWIRPSSVSFRSGMKSDSSFGPRLLTCSIIPSSASLAMI